MNVDASSSPIAALAAATPAAPAKKKELGADEFLKLMTEQLRNQDPLKPLQSNEFLGQLAQFSSVQGIQQLNGSFQSLASAMDTGKALQGATLVGRDVLVDGAVLAHDGRGAHGVVRSTGAGELSLEVTDAGGAVVRRIGASSPGAGDVPFAWDGVTDDGRMAPAGNYALTARLTAGGRTEALRTQVAARVESVSLDAAETTLNLAGLGALPLSAVRRIGGG